jgi:hypothetical protein
MPETDWQKSGLGEETDFDRKEVSPWWDGRKFSLSVSGEGNAGADILPSKIREILQNLLVRYARGEVLQNVVNRNPKTSDTGFTPPPLLPGSMGIRSL